MSSLTKIWTEADFRRELRRLDQYVKETQGIVLNGGQLPIVYSQRAKCMLGAYYPGQKMFKFSLLFFNSDVPEACALDVIRHEYAHYYADVVFGVNRGHGAQFKAACRIVGANPNTYYSKDFEAAAREKEARSAAVYRSTVSPGQRVRHPSFGEGRVLSVDCKQTTAWLRVDFGSSGIKLLDEAWLRANGIL